MALRKVTCTPSIPKIRGEQSTLPQHEEAAAFPSTTIAATTVCCADSTRHSFPNSLRSIDLDALYSNCAPDIYRRAPFIDKNGFIGRASLNMWGGPAMSALRKRGIRNYELTQELGLRPRYSIYELNEVIFHHISIEKTEKLRVEQDRLLIEYACKATTTISTVERPQGDPHQCADMTGACGLDNPCLGTITRALIGVVTEAPNNGGIVTLKRIANPF
ncbi:hypothetical protein ACLOJK_029189 [Asimina triloba]